MSFKPTISMLDGILSVTIDYMLLSDLVRDAKRLPVKPRINLFTADDGTVSEVVLSYHAPFECGHDDMPPWTLRLRLAHESSGVELRANRIGTPLDMELLLDT